MTQSQVQPIPEGYQTVTPFVIVKGAAELIDYLVAAFDAVELGRVGEPGSIGHAEVRIGDSVVMMFDSKPGWPATPAFLRLYVADCDATYEQALRAGGTSVTKPTDMLWGDRACRVRDPLGNLWWIMTHVEDVSPDEEARRWSDPGWLEKLAYAQNAEFAPGSPEA
jgi:PhnB protein